MSQQAVLTCHNCIFEWDEGCRAGIHRPSDADECKICRRNVEVKAPYVDNYLSVDEFCQVILERCIP